MKKLVILADFAWDYPARNSSKKFGKGARGHYPTLKDAVFAVFLRAVAEATEGVKDVAFLNWVTNPKLPVFFGGIEFMQEGYKKKDAYRYSTKAFTWIKTNKDGTPFRGPGNYTAANEEGVYLLTKGSMEPTTKLVDSVILAPKQKHSQKPEEVFHRIVRMYHPGDGHQYRYIELFARKSTHPAFETFGNETSGNDIFEDLRKLAGSLG